LIHWPFPFKPDEQGETMHDSEGKAILLPIPIIDTWRAMEALVDEGLVRSIGVSNFSISKLKDLLGKCRIKPAVNQVELHPFLPQDELIKYCHQNNIAVEAYSPLGSGEEPSILANSTIVKVAEMTKSTPAQVLIGWAIKRNTIPLPKTIRESRLMENATVPDLTDEMMKIISNGIKERHRFCDSMSWTRYDCFDDDKFDNDHSNEL